MSITLDIPEQFLAETLQVGRAEAPRRLQIELACAFYAQGQLTLGQAAELAGLDRYQMGEELARRNLPRHYTGEDLKADLQYGSGE